MGPLRVIPSVANVQTHANIQLMFLFLLQNVEQFTHTYTWIICFPIREREQRRVFSMEIILLHEAFYNQTYKKKSHLDFECTFHKVINE